MTPAIAIVGLACRYPDAKNPSELWENVLAQRRAFRRIPPERLRLEDYSHPDPDAPDKTYLTRAALIEDYHFDRVGFRVVGSSYRAADPVHWLALDVAAGALADAGFADGEGIDGESTGVILGNTLTGEFSRANLMRLRWPYVRRVIDAGLSEEGIPRDRRSKLLAELETRYKKPFPPIGEESLAGGLANTIAGRICNHFDFKGGGYTVDGACASSLLAVTNACAMLLSGDLDVALAGGVDLSLDPFELVGFAKVGALAPEEMRIYDERSAGFWPGEGCGFVVLMRREDAIARDLPIRAVIRGWGISSDGSGGITRPEVAGQRLALRRAYARAGFGIDTIGLFEGHGTGTSVGDATELSALTLSLREAGGALPTAIGSIKANIGHTKAAAGVAGIIKAVMALRNRCLPPTTGCEMPHAELRGESPSLRVLREAEDWPAKQPMRAAVSAMGFGGINSHVVIEGVEAKRKSTASPRWNLLGRSAQDAEVFLFSARDHAALRSLVEKVADAAPRLSRAELADLAASLVRGAHPEAVRAAVVARTPEQLSDRLARLLDTLDKRSVRTIDAEHGVFAGGFSDPPLRKADTQVWHRLPAGENTGWKPVPHDLQRAANADGARIGFLFPGQGSPSHIGGGILRRRFPEARAIYEEAQFATAGDGVDTRVAQPAIVTASAAAAATLRKLGVNASIAVGHSLGELTAYHWAGVYDAAGLIRIASARGEAMASLGDATGAMASVRACADEVREMLADPAAPGPITIAGLNAPRQTVVSGEASAIDELVRRAEADGRTAVRLPVSHAFHSPLVADAESALAEHLADETFAPTTRAVVSTITGEPIEPGADLHDLLRRQVTSPVRFEEALSSARREADVWIEVGPGRVLTGLARECGLTDVVATDAGGPSLEGVLSAIAAAHVCGSTIDADALFADRVVRPLDLDHPKTFLANPCEEAPTLDDEAAIVRAGLSPARSDASPRTRLDESTDAALSPLELVRKLVAARAELPPETVGDDCRLLSDLHLNSISVGQIVADVARRLGAPVPLAPTEYANATVIGMAKALEAQMQGGATQPTIDPDALPEGVDTWIRDFTMEWVERSPSPSRRLQPARSSNLDPSTPIRSWQVISPEHHPLGERLRSALNGQDGRSDRREDGRSVPRPSGSGHCPSQMCGTRFQPVNPPVGNRCHREEPLPYGRGSDGDRAGDSPALTVSAGVVVILPEDDETVSMDLLLTGARAVVEHDADRFVLVQTGLSAASFAKTLHLEMKDVAVVVMDVPADHPGAVDWIAAEIASPLGYAQVRYDETGRRFEPVLRLSRQVEVSDEPPLGPDDVLLVTGGGKGIAAECALHLARKTGVRLVLMGRSDPQIDEELQTNLSRLHAMGARVEYIAADVTDRRAVRPAIDSLPDESRPITALIHAAGVNEPQPLSTLDGEAFARTVGAKVDGARNVLACLDANRLRLLVAFGSIIARTGLPGEADYGVANEWLTRLTEQWGETHPHCRTLAVEWSLWSGVGMGHRLGRVDALMRQGITPITPDDGIEHLYKLLQRPTPAALIVTGRFGTPPTLHVEDGDLPLLRFVEKPRYYCPGVEMVVDAELSRGKDPYVSDHALGGERLLPAVMALEAMAQVATALGEDREGFVFEDVAFAQPIVVPTHGTAIMRIAALMRETGDIEVAIRAESSEFRTDHFRGRCCSKRAEAQPDAPPKRMDHSPPDGDDVGIDPSADLYGGILFHRGRFRRLHQYRHLSALSCRARITPSDHEPWFSRYLPDRLLLGDPGCRDAAIHAIQACIPHARLIPVGVERIECVRLPIGDAFQVAATERRRDGDLFTYDMEILTAEGSVLERWHGLRLRKVETVAPPDGWTPALLAPYAERRLADLLPQGQILVALNRNGRLDPSAVADHRRRTDQAIRTALGRRVAVLRRTDGKAHTDTDDQVSAAHSGDLTLAVAATGRIGCDLESAPPRTESVWADLLGAPRFALAQTIARQVEEELATAATRVWGVMECLKKAGAPADTPLTLDSCHEDGWVTIRAGARRAATFAAHFRGATRRVVLTVSRGT